MMRPSNEHHHALPSGSRLEGLRIEGVLGHGGFGITYRAVDEDLDRLVAIKEYLPREVALRDRDSTVLPVSESDRETFEWGLERFLEEARTLARFEHPNIIGVRRFLRAHGTAYLVMDYCDGESLEALLEREGCLSPERLEVLVDPLLDALETLHDAGVTHRDIKPGNIYLRADGSPVLLDFGAARQALAHHSRSVTAMATPGYAAFEQYSTKGHQGPWTDLYGLSATLYRCVTGNRPPDASDRMLEDELVPAVEAAFEGYPSAILERIDAGLSMRPSERPQDIPSWRPISIGMEDRSSSIPELKSALVSDPNFKDGGGTARYRVLGEFGEIIEDKETGLHWQRCSLGQTWNGNTCFGSADTFTWEEAIAAAARSPGWRLPDTTEIKTLLYCSSGLPALFGNGKECRGEFHSPTIVLDLFPNTPDSPFWSGSRYGSYSSNAWVINFNNGKEFWNHKSNRYSVRLVRQNP